MSEKKCRYCGGGSVDLPAHEDNCVMRSDWKPSEEPEHDENGPPIDIWSSFHKAVIKSESQYSPSETEEFVATSKAIEKLLSKLDKDDKNTLNRLLAKQTDIFKNYLSERELCNCGVYRWLHFHGQMTGGWQCPVHGVKT